MSLPLGPCLDIYLSIYRSIYLSVYPAATPRRLKGRQSPASPPPRARRLARLTACRPSAPQRVWAAEDQAKLRKGAIGGILLTVPLMVLYGVVGMVSCPRSGIRILVSPHISPHLPISRAPEAECVFLSPN